MWLNFFCFFREKELIEKKQDREKEIEPIEMTTPNDMQVTKNSHG